MQLQEAMSVPVLGNLVSGTLIKGIMGGNVGLDNIGMSSLSSLFTQSLPAGAEPALGCVQRAAKLCRNIICPQTPPST